MWFPRIMHAWPCNPFHQGEGRMERLAEVPWLALTRCRGCGSLWELPDRGARRITVRAARETFGIEVGVHERDLGRPQSIVGVRMESNRGALVRLVVVTDSGWWEVKERGALLPQPWIIGDGLEATTAEEALGLARATWGEDAAAALRLGLDCGFDPRQLGALDLAQGLPRETWERPWQPRTAGIVEAMFAAGSDPGGRVAAAVAAALEGGVLAREDVVAGGLLA